MGSKNRTKKDPLSMRGAAELMGVFHIAGLKAEDKQAVNGCQKNLYAKAIMAFFKDLRKAKLSPLPHPAPNNTEEKDSLYQDAAFLKCLQEAGLTRELAREIVQKPDNLYAIYIIRKLQDPDWRKNILNADRKRIAIQQDKWHSNTIGKLTVDHNLQETRTSPGGWQGPR